MVSRRQRRVSDLIHKKLSDLLQKKVSDPRLEFVTVTAVEISPDLCHAHVYVSVLGDQEARRKALDGLAHASGFLRHELGLRLSLRYIPHLTFYLDDSLQRSERILELLRQIEEGTSHGKER